MPDKDFIERELPDFSNFGELPEDLRNTGPISLPDGSFNAPLEGDTFGVGTGGIGSSSSGGADRAYMVPIPPGAGAQVNWSAINYFPRGNFESFRSQRFLGWGRALLPPDPVNFVSLTVNMSGITPGSPQTDSGGTLSVPSGYAAVITGIKQWVGDANAFNKANGDPDDIAWSVEVASASVFAHGNFSILVSSLTNESKMYVIVNENSSIILKAMNKLASSDAQARDIAVAGSITGHWFPLDEIDDLFKNR